jgi:hypothetical protein
MVNQPMRMKIFLGLFGFCLFLAPNVSTFVYAKAQVITFPLNQQYSTLPKIHVEVSASTWKTRGGLLYDIEGTVRRKLTSAGFLLVRDQAKSHDAVYYVDYQERRGEAYGINQFGTIISAKFRLERPEHELLHEIRIEETSHPTISGPPPYLNTLQNFQTNPYFFFLGDILQGYLRYQHDAQLVLIEIINNLESIHFYKPYPYLPDFSLKDEAHYMTPNEELFQPTVVRRVLQTLADQKDFRLVPSLYNLIKYPDVYVRVESLKAFSTFQVKKAIPLVKEVSLSDKSTKVRAAALKALQSLQS